MKTILTYIENLVPNHCTIFLVAQLMQGAVRSSLQLPGFIEWGRQRDLVFISSKQVLYVQESKYISPVR